MKLKQYSYSISFIFLLIGCTAHKNVVSFVPTINQDVIETSYYKLFIDATKHALFGNYPSAVTLYNACLEIHPYNPAPFYQLSSIYIRNNDARNAIKYARRACELDTVNIWYKKNLANLYQYIGRLDSAAILYEEIISVEKNEELKYNLAIIYSQFGNYDKALTLLNEIISKNVGNREVLIMKHNVYNSMKDYDAAIDVLEDLIDYFPEDITNYGILAEYLVGLERFADARKMYHTMLEIDSVNGLTFISLAEFQIKLNNIDSAFYYYGKAFKCDDIRYEDKMGIIVDFSDDKVFVQNNNKNIIDLLKRIEKIERNFTYYAAYSDICVSLEKFDEAKIYLDSTLMYEKSNFQIWEQTLLINSYINNNEEVIRIANNCLQYFNDKPTIYLFKAYAENNLGAIDSAIINAEKILNLNPIEPLKIQTYALLAELFRKNGNNESSDDYFEKILEIQNDNLIVRNNYAYYLALRKTNLLKAKELSKFTIEMEPENATYLDTYGWVLFQMGKYEEAKEFIEKAIRNGAYNNPEVIEHYGDIMIELDRCSEAIEAYEKILDIDNDYDIVEKIERTKSLCK